MSNSCDPSNTLITKKQLLFTYNRNSNSVNDLNKKMQFSYIVRNSKSANLSKKTTTALTFCLTREVIYLFGNTNAEYLLDGLINWVIVGNLNIERNYLGGAIINNRNIYAIGGCVFSTINSEATECLNSVETFDVQNRDFVWRVSNLVLPTVRAHFKAIEYNNKLYCIGGINSTPCSLISTIDVLENNSFSTLDSSNNLLDTPITLLPLPDKTSVVDFSLYKNQPSENPFLYNTAFRQQIEAGVRISFNPPTDPFYIWNDASGGIPNVPTLPLSPTSPFNWVGRRRGHSLSVYNGSIYIIGGCSMIDNLYEPVPLPGYIFPYGYEVDFSMGYFYFSVFTYDGITPNLIAGNNWNYSSILNRTRCFHDSIVYQGKIYVMGGLTKSGVYVDVSDNDGAGSYTLLNSYRISEKINDFVSAGSNIEYTKQVEVFDGISWTIHPEQTIKNRVGANAVLFKDKIYLVGGTDENGNYVSQPEYFDGTSWTLDTSSTNFSYVFPGQMPAAISTRQQNIFS